MIKNFTPFPERRTQRLFLRKINASDCEVILFLRTDAKVTEFIERPEHRKTKNISDARILITELDSCIEANHSITWGIALKQETPIIGTICLWNFSHHNKTAEVGYDLDPQFQHKGFMNEALKAIVDFGFHDLHLESIEACTHALNEPSIKLLMKHRFRHNEDRIDSENPSNIIFELENIGSN